MRTKVTFILFIFFSIHILAQDIEVKSMKIVSTSSANAGARKDNNGAPSGLVRVQLKEVGAQFSGNILGDVEYKNGEYWVYMAMGSKRLDIKHPNYLPVTVIFADYGVKKLASGAEYQMTTKANKEKAKAAPSKKGMAAIQVTPSNATLSIDGTPVNPESGGLYTLSLPYGTHYYSVQYGNFAINNQMVKIDKTPKTIKVDLTEYFAKLSIDCQEKDASIYINDELKGVGSCEEMVIPDKYVIRVEKDGYHPLSQTVTLEDNEEFRHRFPKMDAIAGTLKVNYDPLDAEVVLDGKKIGVTPLSLNNVPVGQHKLEIRKNNCVSETRNIIISEEKELEIKGALKMPLWDKLLNEARKGDGCAMNMIGHIYSSSAITGIGTETFAPCKKCYKKLVQNTIITDSDDDVYLHGSSNQLADPSKEWQNTLRRYCEGNPDGIDLLDYCTPKAIKWFEKSVDAKFSHSEEVGKSYAMLWLMACYAARKNYEKAFYWANKCYHETTNHSKGISFFLAWFYYYGRGVSKDVNKAMDLLHASQGCFSQYFSSDENIPNKDLGRLVNFQWVDGDGLAIVEVCIEESIEGYDPFCDEYY